MAKTSIRVNESVEGQTIEQKIEAIVNNNEPIADGAPIIWTERKDGVMPAYDIRTDRWEVANDAMDKVTKARLAKRDERLKVVKGGQEGDGKPESIQGQADQAKGDQKT